MAEIPRRRRKTRRRRIRIRTRTRTRRIRRIRRTNTSMSTRLARMRIIQSRIAITKLSGARLPVMHQLAAMKRPRTPLLATCRHRVLQNTITARLPLGVSLRQGGMGVDSRQLLLFLDILPPTPALLVLHQAVSMEDLLHSLHRTMVHNMEVPNHRTSTGAPNHHHTSTGVPNHRRTSTGAPNHHHTSTEVNSTGVHHHRLTSTGVHHHRLTSTGVHHHHLTSTGVHHHHLTSTGVHHHPHPSKGVHHRRLTSTGIHHSHTSTGVHHKHPSTGVHHKHPSTGVRNRLLSSPEHPEDMVTAVVGGKGRTLNVRDKVCGVTICKART